MNTAFYRAVGLSGSLFLGMLAVNPLRGATENNVYSKGEVLLSSDIALSTASLQALKSTGETTRLRMEAVASRIAIDYRPPEAFLIGEAESISEYALGANVQAQNDLTEGSSAEFSLGYTDGFSNYRSLWIDTYYRQLFGGIDGYERSDPWSGFAELIFRHEFLPATGILLAGVSFQYEETPILWEMDLAGNLEPAASISRMGSLYGAIEALLNRKTRVRAQLWLSERTNRDLRLIVATELIRALAEDLFLKANYGHAREGDAFHGNSFNLELEWEINERYSISLYGNYYEDTGEFEETASAVQLTAPRARTRELGVKFHYERFPDIRFEVYAAYFQSRYASAGETYAFTSALYADRDWLSAGLSFIRFF